MMLHRRIETKEAFILLYAMQVVSTNMAHLNGEKTQRKTKSQKKGQEIGQEKDVSNAEPSAAPSSTEATTASDSKLSGVGP